MNEFRELRTDVLVAGCAIIVAGLTLGGVARAVDAMGRPESAPIGAEAGEVMQDACRRVADAVNWLIPPVELEKLNDNEAVGGQQFS